MRTFQSFIMHCLLKCKILTCPPCDSFLISDKLQMILIIVGTLIAVIVAGVVLTIILARSVDKGKLTLHNFHLLFYDPVETVQKCVTSGCQILNLNEFE